MMQTFRQYTNSKNNSKCEMKRNDSKNRKITSKHRICQFFTRMIKCYNTKSASLWKREKVGKSYKFTSNIFLPTLYISSSIINYLNCRDNPTEGYLYGICEGDNISPLKLRFKEANSCQEKSFQIKYYCQTESEGNNLKVNSSQIVELCHTTKKRLSSIAENDLIQKENFDNNGQFQFKE